MVLDIVFLLIIIMCVYYGFKKGMLKTIASLATMIVGIWVALYFYRSFIMLLERIPIINNMLTEIKKGIYKILMLKLEESGVTEFFKGLVSQNVINQGNSAVANSVTNIIYSITMMLILLVVVKVGLALTVKIIGIFEHLPVIKQVNRVLGGCIGLINGVLICYVVATLMFVVMANVDVKWLTDNIKESNVAKYFFDTNIIIKAILK